MIWQIAQLMITLCGIAFAAGINYVLIKMKIESNAIGIKGLRTYIEKQLTVMSLKIDELQKMVELHDKLFKLMGFRSESDVKVFMKRRRGDEEN